MLPIPAENRILKIFLCAVMVLNVALAAFVIAGPDRGYCSGIEGNVLSHSAFMTPEACPNAVLVIQEAKSDRVVTKVTADENGNFSLRLAPGRYRISLDGGPDGAVRYAVPQVQTVEAGHLTRVTVFADEKPIVGWIPERSVHMA